MSLLKVQFEKEHGGGLKSSSIYINGERLKFENMKAEIMLPAGEEFEIYWRIFGEPRSTLTVKYSVKGVTDTAVDGSRIASNRNRKSDFKFITLTGG